MQLIITANFIKAAVPVIPTVSLLMREVAFTKATVPATLIVPLLTMTANFIKAAVPVIPIALLHFPPKEDYFRD